MRIFVSYSRKNSKLVKSVVDYLEPTYHVWFDTKNLIGGQDWWNEIVTEICKSEIVIYFVSQTSNRSEWCQKELEVALQENKPILPVRIEDISLPQCVSHLHGISMFKGLGRVSKRSLVLGIKNISGHSINTSSEAQRISDITRINSLTSHLDYDLLRDVQQSLNSSQINQA
ncbi:MAG: toll/interleukin-1 receptor domain-containing protein, partial [Chloroflexota bacterium]